MPVNYHAIDLIIDGQSIIQVNSKDYERVENVYRTSFQYGVSSPSLSSNLLISSSETLRHLRIRVG